MFGFSENKQKKTENFISHSYMFVAYREQQEEKNLTKIINKIEPEILYKPY